MRGKFLHFSYMFLGFDVTIKWKDMVTYSRIKLVSLWYNDLANTRLAN